MAKTNITPAPNYVLIEPKQPESKTSTGIILPETHEGEKPQIGTVIAVGLTGVQDGQKIESPAKKGDQIIYKKWGGNEYKTVEGKELIFVKFEDILGIIS